MKEKVREREIDFFHLLVYFSNGYNSRGEVRKKPGARNCILVSHMDSRDPSTRPILYCLPRNISRELDQRQNIWTHTGSLL